MKREIFLLTLVMSFLRRSLIPIACAEERKIDVVNLKDGTVIRGEIFELDLERHVSIRTDDGQEHLYMVEEVRKIDEEIVKIEATWPVRTKREEREHKSKVTGMTLIGTGTALSIAGGAVWKSKDVDNSVPAAPLITGLVVVGIGASVWAMAKETPIYTSSSNFSVEAEQNIRLTYRFQQHTATPFWTPSPCRPSGKRLGSYPLLTIFH